MPDIKISVVLALTLLFGPLASHLFGQGRLGVGRTIVVGPDGSAENEGSGAGSFPAPDRGTLQQLQRAREAVKQGRSGEALDGLQEILKSKEDYFIQPDKKDNKEAVYHSLKSEARSLIGQLPKEGLELYELRCGAEARSKLKEAIASGDPGALGEVAAQFFYTQAGNEATFLMGMYYVDRRSPRAALELFQRLQGTLAGGARFEPALGLSLAACYQQLGQFENCRKALMELKQNFGQSPLMLGGREVAWFEKDRDAVAWAGKLVGTQSPAQPKPSDDWLMPRGDAARNASASASAPLMNLLWRVKVAKDEDMVSLKAQQQDYREKGTPIVPCLQPLAVGDVVLMRDLETLVAVDFVTGKQIWNIIINEDRDSNRQSRSAMNRFRGGQNMPNSIGQRVWDDSVYGSFSSDGRLVFTIEDLGLGVGQQNPGVFFFRAGAGRPETTIPGQFNRLSAHEILTSQGKALWDIGGPGGANALPQAETFFLGPPLVMHGVLYVEGEYRDEIRLLALDAATGRQLWMQHLAMVERNITQDPLRRLAGASPSYADGVLVCPTGAGCAVAVDLTSHSLLWGCRYGHMKGAADMQRQQQIFAIQNGYYPNMGSIPRWADSAAIIAEGKVILTPAEADALYCLNLSDGKTLWGPLPRKSDPSTPPGDERLYVACVHQGNVIVVGQRQVEAFRLTDGKPAWDAAALKLPEDAVVSGRGIYSHAHYFLPLSSAEVAEIDLDTGKIVASVKSQKGSVPGNLICHRGMILSQGLDGLEKFYQIDAARDIVRNGLASNPNDPECLSLNGELLLNDGKPAEAVAQFRKAYALDATGESHERTRELFRDALLSGLDKDFAAHRAYSAEIEGLLDDTSQRSVYLRLMASGFHKAHDWPAALDAYLKLIDLPAAKTDLEEIDHAHLVRRDRWTQARLVALRADGGAETAAAIDNAVAQRLNAIHALAAPKRLEELRKFVAFFTDQPAAAQARAELAQLAAKEGALLEAELAIEAGRSGSDPAAHAAALADEVEMLGQNGKPDEAATLFRSLKRQYGDVPCRDGRRADEFLAMLAPDSPLRKVLGQSAPAWPLGLVEAQRTSGIVDPRMGRVNRMAIVLHGASPAFADTGLRFDAGNGQQPQTVCGYDGQGKQAWEVRLVEPGRQINTAMYNINQTLARSCGHVLLFSTGSKIFGLDPLKLSGRDSQVLWSQDLGDPSADEPSNGFPFAQRVIVNMGVMRVQQPFRMDPFGPTTSRIVCFQRLRNLVAVDPLTGETLWVRKDLPQNVEIFGDDEYIFALPAQANQIRGPYGMMNGITPVAANAANGDDKNEALVFRSVDGEFVGKRKIPQNQRFENPYNYDGLERMMPNPFAATGSTFIGRDILYLDMKGGDKGATLRLYDPWQQRDLWTLKGLASGTKSSLVGQDAVGVLEPSGHFALYALPDGRKMFDSKLLPETSLTELVLLRLGDQYIVVAHDGRAHTTHASNNQQPSQMLQGSHSLPIRRGRVYALDMQGKTVWPEPVDVENQHLLLSQPSGLPVVVFASFRYDSQHPNQLTSLIKVIDRRNGLIVYDKDRIEPVNSGVALEISGDAHDKTVDLRMLSACVTLNFTDKPLLNTRNPKPEIKATKAKTTDALFDAIRDAFLPGGR